MKTSRSQLMIFTFIITLGLCYQHKTAAMDPPLDYSAIAKKYGLHYARGLQLENAEQLKAALDEFTKSIIENPNQKESYTHRAQIRYQLNDYAGAVADCNKVFSLSKASPLSTQEQCLLFSLRGYSLKELAKYNEAIPDLEKALKYNFLPNPYLKVELGITYMKVGNFDFALKQFLLAREEIPQDGKRSKELDTLIKETRLKLQPKKNSR